MGTKKNFWNNSSTLMRMGIIYVRQGDFRDEPERRAVGWDLVRRRRRLFRGWVARLISNSMQITNAGSGPSPPGRSDIWIPSTARTCIRRRPYNVCHYTPTVCFIRASLILIDFTLCVGACGFIFAVSNCSCSLFHGVFF